MASRTRLVGSAQECPAYYVQEELFGREYIEIDFNSAALSGAGLPSALAKTIAAVRDGVRNPELEVEILVSGQAPARATEGQRLISEAVEELLCGSNWPACYEARKYAREAGVKPADIFTRGFKTYHSPEDAAGRAAGNSVSNGLAALSSVAAALTADSTASAIRAGDGNWAALAGTFAALNTFTTLYHANAVVKFEEAADCYQIATRVAQAAGY